MLLRIGHAGTGMPPRGIPSFPIPLWPCEIHAPQQAQSGVVLARRVRYSPRLFPRQRASMRLLVESWKHASTRRRFWITWRLTSSTYPFFSPAVPRSAHTDAACLWPLRHTQERGM
ncbi:hypothetical protein TcCL_Unassigned01233 [Trypanosoma cruzi]|nr:hypothetical protein TcCL_Unassigned01233 [Trypanosoma cruzi]